MFRLPVKQGLLVEGVRPAAARPRPGWAGTTQVTVAGVSYNLGGDVIVERRCAVYASLDRLRDVIAAKKPGETIKLEIYRGDSTKPTVEVKLGRQPSSPSG